jgi:general L-amino acid transport system permease protein
LRRNLFSSPLNALITVVTLAFTVWVIAGLTRWILYDAAWQPILNNLKLFAVYRYPDALLWRPLAVVALVMFLLGLSAGPAPRGDSIIRGLFWSFALLVTGIAAVSFVLFPSVQWLWSMGTAAALAGFAIGRAFPQSLRALPWLWAASLPVAFVLLYGTGAEGGLRLVTTNLWGGFLLTLVLALVGIVVSFPIGVFLALGRRSRLPIIKVVCVAYIEIIRGAPLITWLFIASLMVPLLFNVDPRSVDALTRALVAIVLFSAAYMAENVRGGLQAVPKGQYEAADALGLSAWDKTRLIVLPQALRAVIPAIVGQSIGLFKDTSLVAIVGLTDFFKVSDLVANQPTSLMVPGGIRMELSLFLCVVYFFFCYRMSVASRQLERQLGVGTR